jgi:PTS system nitrogen regulatory IIA component
MTTSLLPLLARGGIIRGVTGTTPAEALQDLITKLKLPGGLNSTALLNTVLEREDIQPTSVGHGIALPHPRNPVITAEADQFIAVGVTERPLDWRALDKEAVRIIILIVCASARSHLLTLSKLNYLCTQQHFLDLLHNGAASKDIERYIAETEKTWET